MEVHSLREPNWKVALITMPWAQPVEPNLTMGQIHATLTHKGVEVKSFSFNLLLLKLLAEAYENNSSFSPLEEYQAIIGANGLGDLLFCDGSTFKNPTHFDKALLDKFLDLSLNEVMTFNPDTIMFTPLYLEMWPSIALANRLKKTAPKKKISIYNQDLSNDIKEVLEKNIHSIESIFYIDDVVSMAEDFEAVYRPKHLPKIVSRTLVKKKEIVIPEPNFDDFFHRLNAYSLKGMVYNQLWLTQENSKGCWWAETKKCGFCALTRSNSTFRRQKQEISAEISENLANRYKLRRIHLFDWIQDRKLKYFKDKTFRDYDYILYAQSLANITFNEFLDLKKSGAYLQLGIESFSTKILNILNKGTNLLENIHALRTCAELDIPVFYNHLFGFPFDRLEYYEDLLSIFEKITFLPPPDIKEFHLRRISPIFDNPENYNITDIKPKPWYNAIYGNFNAEDRYNVASEFEFNTSHLDDDLSLAIEKVKNKIVNWQTLYRELGVTLTYRRGPDFIEIKDGRSGTEVIHLIEGIEGKVFSLALNGPIDIHDIHKSLDKVVDLFSITSSINKLESKNFLIKEGNDVLSLPIAFMRDRRCQ